ncbi:hypothetical protein LB535_20880 [Mesorhizobium sp. CA10]|uniref:hypothetical protein n=1 Tax=Mesorhizobium sp. CA10 TaxID=588495 RepID=UPI001CCD6B97|nr:hypothetical protein [Mesorhizobium sp. CA10]MBZ9884806.1 hypothetical protein [Mesorhizobium sp. CA10]
MIKALLIMLPVAALGTLGKCGFQSYQPPPKPCDDPLKCISISLVTDNKCQYPFAWSTGNMYKATNLNPTKTIIFTYNERGDHINSTLPPEKVAKDRRVLPGISNAIELGCKTTGSEAEHYVIWSYTKAAACFESGNCVVSKPTPGNPPPKVRSASCEQECSRGGDFCLDASLDTSNPDQAQLKSGLSKFSNEMLTTAPPSQIDISGIAGAITNISGRQCTHGPFMIDDKFNTRSGGSECDLGVKIGTPDVAGVVLHLPSTLEGRMGKLAGKFQIAYPDIPTAATLSIYDTQPTPNEYGDVIRKITGTGNSIMLETDQTYCVRFDLG